VANGIDDTPVTTTVSSAIGAGIPVVIVPAMHKSLYEHPAVLENIEKLKRIGVRIVQPKLEEAKAKFPALESILESVIAALSKQDLKGRKFVVTAGPTRGWLDRVRVMTTPSTGKMGIEISREILARGGAVTLVLGPTSEQPPEDAETTRVETSKEMLDAVLKAVERNHADVLISAAAVLDFEPEKREDQKRPTGQDYTVKLVSTPKIIDEARRRFKDLYIVGFKVESGVTDDELDARARERIDSGICDLVVGNDEKRKGVAFGADTNEVVIVGPGGLRKKVELAAKRDVARHIVDLVRDGLKTKT
jgi:phosphopantothenoylcysteine decarboxylase/phosphopantothenate--cysteine ligase